MQFKLDENLRSEVYELFRQRGYEVATVYDQGLRGREDHEIAEVCRSEGRILVSLDLDFSDIRMFPPENYPGLIVLRLRAKGRSAVWNVLQGVLAHLDQESIVGRLWIVDERRIRIRRVRDDED
jgi:predicted nuclease of predicted toxin-antitoxin system